MKIVKYPKTNPWVVYYECPDCNLRTYGWCSSGMSDMWPNFFCNTCNNVYYSEGLKALLWRNFGKVSPCSISERDKPCWISENDALQILKKDEKSLTILKAILHKCPCGGQFAPGANPKCPNCKFEFEHLSGSIERLDDPHALLLHNAILYYDESFDLYYSRNSSFYGKKPSLYEPYQVKIED